MIEVDVSKNPISLDALLSRSTKRGHGARVVFTGMVRDFNQGKNVVGVSYDAFAPLAIVTLQEICKEAQDKWGEDISVQLIHRIGRLEIGEISVAIVVSSRHRNESYRASRYVIEELKERAPIWKQEHYEDGDSAWLKGHALCSHGPSLDEDDHHLIHAKHNHKHSLHSHENENESQR